MKSICFLWEKAEVEESKVFIHCRFSSCELKNSLDYQENILRELNYSCNMNAIVLAIELSDGKNSYTHGMQSFIYFTSQKIDNIALQMICDKFSIGFLTISRMKNYVISGYLRLL